ncbi:MAG: class I SAM-dependent methyltransferase [Microthrixaceae bacterium]|nr:class I SAM-dependent methyltransferase [Microthrixaceae bacterium]
MLVHRQDIRMTLLDSARRRTSFLTWALTVLAEADPGIQDRSEVLWGRAEEVARDDRVRGRFDVVVARSFGRPSVTAECARPFLQSGGLWS